MLSLISSGVCVCMCVCACVCVPVCVYCVCVYKQRKRQKQMNQSEMKRGRYWRKDGGITNSESFEMFPFTLLFLLGPCRSSNCRIKHNFNQVFFFQIINKLLKLNQVFKLSKLPQTTATTENSFRLMKEKQQKYFRAYASHPQTDPTVCFSARPIH